MKVFLIWLSLICCSVANGVFFREFGNPERLAFILVCSIMGAVILLIHRRITRNWEAPLDMWSSPFRFPIFRLSSSLCIFVLMIVAVLMLNGITIKGEFLVSIATMTIASFIAYSRERLYTLKYWI